MLTKTQREMIATRRTLGDSKEDKKRLKYIEYTLRQYAKKQLDSIGDLLLVLKELPDDQLKKIISPSQAYEAMQVVEKLIELLEPASIEAKDGKPHRVYRFNVVGKVSDMPDNTETMVKVSFPAKNEEVELSTYIAIHTDIMVDSLKALPEKPITVKDFNKKVLPQMAKIAMERGQLYQVEGEYSAAWIEDQPNSQEEPK